MDGTNSRTEELLVSGVEETKKPLSRVEAILRGEDVKPLSRIEKALKEGGGGGSKYLYNWDFTKSLVDKVNGRTATLSGPYGHNLERTSEGVVFTYKEQCLIFGSGFEIRGKTIEYDVGYAHFEGNTSYHIRHLVFASDGGSSGSFQMSPFIWRKGIGWSMYGYKSDTGYDRNWVNVWGDLAGSSQEVLDCMSGKTVKIVISKDGNTTSIYLDNVLIGTQTGVNWRGDSTDSFMTFGSSYVGRDETAGDQCYMLKLTGLRIYETKE